MNHFQPHNDNHTPAPETVTIGGLPISVLGRAEAARMMLAAAATHKRGRRPLYYTSANGEVIARINTDAQTAALFADADQIVADGQPMVFASRFLTRSKLPERVATTDLFHDAARLAEASGQSFYMLGADEAENARAVAAIRRTYPRLRIAGHSHGYHKGAALTAKLAEINALAPDILWLAMGVPQEQVFVRDHAAELPQVGLIKTSGGLFNFLSGTNTRAPDWMQRIGLEWAYRLILEPRRLGWRYLSTNPQAAYFILTRSQ
ncbi:WecB/TagA/CpsF family glycosyltransferase [Mariluticola halotolerans]|uniref:WecB/TagA/CpsF family glycosyltransferase n=1 Tax=Mariluticola halotolerans TaxID=2909283 RepID=UPI0034A0B7C2